MPFTDSELIERSAVDPELFGEIFDRHFDAIVGYCVRRTGASRGEELAGDVFRWAFENRRRFDLHRTDARPWLFGIASNLVRQSLRSAGRQWLAYDRWRTREVGDGPELASQVASAVDAQHDLATLTAALERRPVEEVETLLLFAWEELSYAQIAEALSVPVGTVRSRLHRVRQHLQAAQDASLVGADAGSEQGRG